MLADDLYLGFRDEATPAAVGRQDSRAFLKPHGQATPVPQRQPTQPGRGPERTRKVRLRLIEGTHLEPETEQDVTSFSCWNAAVRELGYHFAEVDSADDGPGADGRGDTVGARFSVQQ